MSDRLPRPCHQLLAYRFGPEAEYEGRLVGALERIESGGALRILDALFVQRDAGTGELDAVAVRGTGAGGLVAPLVGFRLDAAQRRRSTQRALVGDRAPAIHDVASHLGPGEAMALVLVEHLWATALEDAVARTGGTPVVSEFVEAARISELAQAGAVTETR